MSVILEGMKMSLLLTGQIGSCLAEQNLVIDQVILQACKGLNIVARLLT